jgi:repressor LexA
MLTRKQKELLVFIHQRLGQGGISPSFDEMRDALGLKSKSGIHRLITGLEERGVIRRLPHRARALEIIRLPEGFSAVQPWEHAKPSAEQADDSKPIEAVDPLHRKAGADPVTLRPGSKASPGLGLRPPGESPRTLPSPPLPSGIEVVSLPLFGRIAAGTPIEALRDMSSFAEVPGTLIGSGDHYALEVEGDSMVDAGIHDGDLAIIRRQTTADSGNVVVALIDGQEATLKRFRRRSGAVALEAANQAYETRLLPPDRVEIQGQLVALIRRYE